MTIFEHWETQKESLRSSLRDQSDLAGVVYQVQHALLQTEQNALAELTDDVLRQQAGVLMSCVKNSVRLLEAQISAQVWVPQKQPAKTAGEKSLWRSAGTVLLLGAVYCSLKGLWIAMVLVLAALCLGFCALILERKAAAQTLAQDEVRVTLNPDPDKLFSLLDGQLRAVDRYLNDFTYLNEQLRGASECSDPAAVSRAADLLEALYECSEEERAPADEAARRLLESLGLRALDYSEDTSRLFNALPSKNVTKTLSPAIVSVKEQRLLRRGTAAVRTGAA